MSLHREGMNESKKKSSSGTAEHGVVKLQFDYHRKGFVNKNKQMNNLLTVSLSFSVYTHLEDI